MTKEELRKEVRRQHRLERLGSNEPRCGICGESDDRCLELHHVADHQRDDGTVAICRNCHRKASDDQKDHPRFDAAADPMLDRIGHFMLGLADLLRLIVEKLTTFGLALIERATPASVGGVA